MDKIILGIDLGTTNTCVGYWQNGNFIVIPDEFGNRTIPSVVAYTSLSRYIGNEAKNQKELNPNNVFYEIKRILGKKYSDPSVKLDKEFLLYDIRPDSEDNIIINTDFDKSFKPEYISSIILSKVKSMAMAYLNREVLDVIITVPAYFNDSQRQATKDAAIIAGLNCIRIINEPTAAALAYGLIDRCNNKSKNIIVYDLGGGTLDVSVLTICDGLFEVRASVGNTHLGGADFDNKIVTYCLNHFKKINNIENYDELQALSLQKLRKSCEKAKMLLSINNNAVIIVKDFYMNKDLFISLSKEKYDEICFDLLILCLKSLEDSLTSSEFKKEEIDEIILVGGMTKTPAIRENISRFFNDKPLNCSVNPDEVVAMGAAINGYILSHSDEAFSDSITLLDIIPLSLGVETFGGIMNTVIPKNTVIPISVTRKYTLDQDYVDSVKIKVYEGERLMTVNNFFVGEFTLNNIDMVPRGIIIIEVKFSVDVNGIITASAEDINKKNKKSIVITGNKGRMETEEIKKLIIEAQEYEATDRIEKNKKKFFYEIDSICNNILINIKNEEFKIKETDKIFISQYANNQLIWLHEKKYNEHIEIDYETVIKDIKKKYGILILSYNKEDQNVKPFTIIQTNSTTIYDEKEIKLFIEESEKEEVSKKLNAEQYTELCELKQELIELCNNINNILINNNFNIKDEYICEIRNLIDDSLLWIYVCDNPTNIEYSERIIEINKLCNMIIDKVNNENICYKDELENLCFSIKGGIDNNHFSFGEDQIVNLSNLINDALRLIDKNCEEEIYKEKILEINCLCNKLYESMIK
jgi:heat shock protein 1/8